MSEQLAGLDLVMRRTELETALARVLDGSVPAGWRSLRFEGRSAGTVSEVQLFADRNGAVKRAEPADETFGLTSQ